MEEEIKRIKSLNKELGAQIVYLNHEIYSKQIEIAEQEKIVGKH